MSKVDTSAEATLQRYWNPNGGGVEPHDAWLLYLRDDVDAVIAALRAERDALHAEVERLKVCLNKANGQTEHFERQYYLAKDVCEAAGEENAALRAEVEWLRAEAADMAEALMETVSHCEVYDVHFGHAVLRRHDLQPDHIRNAREAILKWEAANG